MVLSDYSRTRQKPTQQQLGRVLGIDKSNVTRLCRRMESSEHISQKQCPDDGRARLLTLTEKGARLAARLEQASQMRFTSVMSAIPPHARAGVLSALEALNSAVRQITKDDSGRNHDGKPSHSLPANSAVVAGTLE
jgi:DNA-binding MarR family transcriptional regulator